VYQRGEVVRRVGKKEGERERDIKGAKKLKGIFD